MSCKRCGFGDQYTTGLCVKCRDDESRERAIRREEIDRQYRLEELAIQESWASASRHAELLEAEHQRWYFSLPEHEKRRWDKKVEEEKAQAKRQALEILQNESLRQEQVRQEGERLKEYRQLNSDRLRIIEENLKSKINRKKSQFGFGTWLIILIIGVGCAAYYDQNYGRLEIDKLAGLGLAFKYHFIVIGILAGILFVSLIYFLIFVSNPIKVVPREITIERLKEYRQLNSDRLRIIEENLKSKINRSKLELGFSTWLFILILGVGCAAYYDHNYQKLAIPILYGIGLTFKYHFIVIGILAGILFVSLIYFLIFVSNPIKVIPREITLSESSSDDNLNAQKIELKVLSNELLISESSKNITVPDSIFDPTVKTLTSDNLNISRNSQCPCGSGEKYKNCHGKIT